MKVKKSLLVAGAVASIGLAGVTSVGAVSAATNNRDDLITRIAQKFNLKEDDVEAVVEEHRTQMMEQRQTERKAQIATRLQEAVDAGDLTAEQKTALEAKIQEHTAERQTEREEMQAWAEEQGIDLSEIMPFGGGRGGRNGFGGGQL